MFEHFSFRVPRYGEDAVRKNPFNRKGIICAPEFEELFNSLFKGIDFDKLGSEETEEAFKPRIVRVQMPDTEGEKTEKDEKPFRWQIEDDEDDEEPYIHEPDVVYAEEDEEDEEEESVKEPPSIFDMLNSGKEFGDIVAAKPKHTEIYNQAFGLDDDGNEIEPPEDEEDDEVETEAKNPFVFIANRLTFLIKTSQPIIWDTSTIATPSKDCIFVAFDKEKNPQIDMRVAAKIAHKVNIDMDIQDEIDEYLDGTEWETIYCMPHIMNLKGEDRLGFVFAVTSKEDD